MGRSMAMAGAYQQERRKRLPDGATMTFTSRTTCRLCDHPLPSSKVLDLGNVPLANSYWSDHPALAQETFPLYLQQCGACAHVQLPIVVDPKRLFSEYAYTSGNAGDFAKHLVSFADDLYAAERYMSPKPVIDIGSNDGTLVRLLRGRGFPAMGIDPARNLAAEASQAGNLTIPAFLTVEVARQLRELLGTGAKIVTALNVFAHTDGLHELATAMRILCGEHGRVIIEVADVAEQIRTGDVSSCYFEHLSAHSLRPLVAFLARHDLAVTAAQKLKVQGGSLRVYASPRGTPIDETTIAMFDTPPVDEWQARADRQAADLREKLEPFLSTDPIGGSEVGESLPVPRLAVFGAPARLTALAYSLKLRREDVQCVFDDEPRKVGKFTPGLHWPIVSSAELMARNPPAILVASWNYFDHIRKRFPDYRGEWIVPNREASLADETATIDAR